MNIIESPSGTEEEFEDAEIEARLWRLVYDLFSFRLNEPEYIGKVDDYSSNAVVQEKYLRLNPKSRENWIVLSWLQQTLNSPDEPTELRGVKWMYTKNQVKQKKLSKFTASTANANFNNNMFDKSSLFNGNTTQNSDIVDELDLDAPLRQAKSIHSEDEKLDRTILKYLFELLRAGRYDEALSICEKTGNLTLKLAIRGHNEYIDPEIDGQVLNIEDTQAGGIERKALWRRMCFQISQDTSNSIDVYEKGIYGLLAGSLEPVLELSDSWETQLLAYMQHIVASDAERSLIQAKRIDQSVLTLPMSETKVTNVGTVLDILSNSKNPVVYKQSQDLLRTVIGAIINNTISLLIDQTAEELKKVIMEQVDSPLTENQYLLRVMTHLSLFLQQLGLPAGNEASISLILKSYVELLSYQNKPHLVPIYISFLPSDVAIETYSFLLANLTDPEMRKEHLMLGKKYKLDLENSIRAAVDRVFSETEDAYIPGPDMQLIDEVSDTDIRLYRSVEWFIDAAMWPDAVHSSVYLYRQFLISGRIRSANEFGNRVSSSAILKKYDAYIVGRSSEGIAVSDAERLEIMEYERLITCLNEFNTWNSHYSQLPSRKKGISKAWQDDALQLIHTIYSTVCELSSSWMIAVLDSYESQEQQYDMVYRLRETYVPYLIMELLTVLIEARVVHGRFLKQAVELSNLVASEDGQLYRLFLNGGNLQFFMQRICDAFVDGIASGEEGIYD